MKVFVIFSIFIFCFSCKPQIQEEKPVAQVFESRLYREEITDFIPDHTPKDDSLLMAQSYIRNWITNKLLLHKAIENLSGKEKDIQKQVEEYRTSLLIYQYKQKLIAQRLMDEISHLEVEKYYQENQNNFILSTPIVKAMFFILPKTITNLQDVRKWYKSDNQDDLDKLEEFCLTHAKKYDTFQGKWVEVKYLLNLIPGEISTLEYEILYQAHIEKEDNDHYYFLKINDMRKEQTLAPLEYVEDEIILILKNKKKLQFESELERQINEEGVRKNYVKIY